MKLRARPEGDHLDARIVLYTIIGIWLFNYAIITLRAWIVDFPLQGELAQRRALVTLIGVGLTIVMWRCMQPFDRRTLGFQVMLAAFLALPCALITGVANYYFFNVYDPGSLMEIEQEMPPKAFLPKATELILDYAVSRYFFFIAWAALYLAFDFAKAVRVAERQAAEFAQAAQTAELRALRYQVNPHFLFNTLNSLSALVLTGKKDKAEAMIMNLSNFYRTSLSGDPSEDVPLSEEIALQRLYLEIEAVRFPERLVVEIQVPDALGTRPVPGLILQPLVENAVKHGVSRTSQPVTVCIMACEVDGALEVSVSDTGRSGAQGAGGHGIGLDNVRNRIAARFGDAASLVAGPGANGGWTSTLRLPMIGAND
jgi:two-component system, LytTR family, sensor kinase